MTALSPAPLKVAHISDLHFSELTLNPLQFFSKRWVGNLNLLFSRKKKFNTDQLFSLATLFEQENIRTLIISGDLSTTSLAKEFKRASSLVEHFKERGIHVLTLPGNHDQYTRHAYRNQHFYRYFPSSFAQESKMNLKRDRVTELYLGNRWWCVLLDTALATSLFLASGHFTEEAEKNLASVLEKIPKDHSILLGNHFPFFQHHVAKGKLVRSEALRTLLSRYPNVRFYLHGHTHQRCIADLRPSQLPILLNPGSTAQKKEGGCFILELSPTGCHLKSYRCRDAAWKLMKTHNFEFHEEKAMV